MARAAVDGIAGARGRRGQSRRLAGPRCRAPPTAKIAVFSRNPSAPQIHQLDFLDIAGLVSAVDLAITPAGEQVYGVGSTADTLGMFSETRATSPARSRRGRTSPSRSR